MTVTGSDDMKQEEQREIASDRAHRREARGDEELHEEPEVDEDELNWQIPHEEPDEDEEELNWQIPRRWLVY
jgi:hypothetical protein